MTAVALADTDQAERSQVVEALQPFIVEVPVDAEALPFSFVILARSTGCSSWQHSSRPEFAISHEGDIDERLVLPDGTPLF